MPHCQNGILEPISPFATYIELVTTDLSKEVLLEAITRLANEADGSKIVLGIGQKVLGLIGVKIPELRVFDALNGPDDKTLVPSTQADLFLQVRGNTLDEVKVLEAKFFEKTKSVFTVARKKPSFRFAGGRDLTGYEDGTENPEGEDAIAAVCMKSDQTGITGSSILALQTWQHDLAYFRAQSPKDQDEIIGRRIEDNSEIGDAPAAAHTKRTEQESFEPEAFILRRSMMWVEDQTEGMMFTSYSASPRAFDVQMKRMAGHEDGITDNLFRFSTPLSGAFYWCPPIKDGMIDLSAIVSMK